MNKKLCVLLCFICAFVMFMTACDNGGGSSTDTTAPVITVENVPESGINGRPVTVPEAKATDDKDGDISSKVKLTVAQLKEDGSIKKELLYQVTGNVKNVFTPSGNLMQYSIVFTVKDSAGNKAEKRVDFTAVPDQEKPEITLDTKDFPDFDINTGIVNQYATKDITLPTASAKTLLAILIYRIISMFPSSMQIRTSM